MKGKTDREAILNLWVAGVPTSEIVEAVGAQTEEWIRIVVREARKKGDERAVIRLRRAPETKKQTTKAPDVDWSRKPDYSGMSLTARMFGDPPRGRSALDQREHRA